MLTIRYTLCFLTCGDEVLLLHRCKAPNRGLWNGVGGRIEPGEAPLESVLREVREETGFMLSEARYAGILTWEGFETPPGGLYLFTAEISTRQQPGPCSEGELAWKPWGWLFTSPEVVSNLHVVAPLILGATPAPPQRYHFVYQQGEFIHHEIGPILSDRFVA